MKRLDMGSRFILVGDNERAGENGGGDDCGGGGDALEPDGGVGSVRAIFAGRGIDIIPIPVIGGGLTGRVSGLGRAGLAGVRKGERDEP